MKLWEGYGSEHSANLVMIGKFKTVDNAIEAEELIKKLQSSLEDKIEIGVYSDRYGDEVLPILSKLNFFSAHPNELEQIFYDHHIVRSKDEIIITTEEDDVSLFLKLFIDKGAKIEVYSAHDYPDEEFGRGKR